MRLYEQVELKEYVKGVLPNEWYPTWNEEALKAGAVAIRAFAVHEMRTGFVWDCNWDQVYDPSKRTPETDAAVDAVWDYVWIGEKNYHDNRQVTCRSREEPNCMGQRASQRDAEDGLMFDEILDKYYEGRLWYLPSIEEKIILKYQME